MDRFILPDHREQASGRDSRSTCHFATGTTGCRECCISRHYYCIGPLMVIGFNLEFPHLGRNGRLSNPKAPDSPELQTELESDCTPIKLLYRLLHLLSDSPGFSTVVQQM
uniref:Uncharacterized protein n=1 Tax=Anopheles maculatus TaxID=74869 RepID=A0A182SVL4_9DIPT